MLSEKWASFSLKLLPAPESTLELGGDVKEALFAGERESWELRKEIHEDLPQLVQAAGCQTRWELMTTFTRY